MLDNIDEWSLCVLISCMYQEKDIIERTHVQTNVVVVNQCDSESVEEWDFKNPQGKVCHAKFISTKERGLSRSRNMAMRNAIGDICLFSDDDEELVDGYEKIVLDAYKKQPDADLISFAFNRKNKSFSNNSRKHNIKSLLHTSSVEITFLHNTVIEKGIFFDEKMGSGTGNGSGEENKLLMTCKHKGLKMYYNPDVIGTLLSTDSQWFKGFTPTYFENFGWSRRRILGPVMSWAYVVYWMYAHRNLYKKDITTKEAIRSYYKGWKSKR